MDYQQAKFVGIIKVELVSLANKSERIYQLMIMKDDIIEFIIEKLTEYPHIKFERKSYRDLEIFCNDVNGFNIILEVDQRENTLHFGTFHWHFDKNETRELLNQLVFGLTGIARVKELSKNGKVYKWILQIQDKEGIWRDNGTMGLVNMNFWTTPKTKYLQNSLLSKEIIFAEQ